MCCVVCQNNVILHLFHGFLTFKTHLQSAVHAATARKILSAAQVALLSIVVVDNAVAADLPKHFRFRKKKKKK